MSKMKNMVRRMNPEYGRVVAQVLYVFVTLGVLDIFIVALGGRFATQMTATCRVTYYAIGALICTALDILLQVRDHLVNGVHLDWRELLDEDSRLHREIVMICAILVMLWGVLLVVACNSSAVLKCTINPASGLILARLTWPEMEIFIKASFAILGFCNLIVGCYMINRAIKKSYDNL